MPCRQSFFLGLQPIDVCFNLFIAPEFHKKQSFWGRVRKEEEMSSVRVGQTINIPCKISGGVLPGEVGITVDTATGPVSGFIRGQVVRTNGDDGYITGTVLGIEGDTVTVRLRGSFFTTTGIAYFAKNALTQMEHA
jgi:hypothetical protein